MAGSAVYRSETGRHLSYGNGAGMRASAVGWFFDTLRETEEVAKISAEITHNHHEGIKGAQATAAAIWMARNGKDKYEIRSYIESRFGYDLHRTWEQLHPVYGWDSSCQGTVPEAMIAFLDSTDFEDAIRKAVSLGGDSDTLACITGGIAEAYWLRSEMANPADRSGMSVGQKGSRPGITRHATQDQRSPMFVPVLIQSLAFEFLEILGALK